MKAGDWVRFCQRESHWGGQHWEHGLLIEYHTWEKVARILWEGKVISVRAGLVQKAGKRDFEKEESKDR